MFFLAPSTANSTRFCQFSCVAGYPPTTCISVFQWISDLLGGHEDGRSSVKARSNSLGQLLLQWNPTTWTTEVTIHWWNHQWKHEGLKRNKCQTWNKSIIIFAWSSSLGLKMCVKVLLQLKKPMFGAADPHAVVGGYSLKNTFRCWFFRFEHRKHHKITNSPTYTSKRLYTLWHLQHFYRNKKPKIVCANKWAVPNQQDNAPRSGMFMCI